MTTSRRRLDAEHQSIGLRQHRIEPVSAADLLQESEHGGALILSLVQYGVKPTMKIALWSTAGNEAAVTKGLRERHARHATDAQTRFDGALDGFGVLQLEYDFQIGQDAVHGALEGLTSARARLADDPRGLHQIGVAQRLPRGEGVLRRAEHHELVGAPARDLQFWFLKLAFDEADVDFEVEHFARDLDGVGDVQA